MFKLFKDSLNGFVNYLTSNSSESFDKMKNNSGQFIHSDNMINSDNITKKVKTKLDWEENKISTYKPENEETTKEVTKQKPNISYVILIKRQRLIRSLKKVTKSISGLFPAEKNKKQQKQARAMIDYKMNMICVKAQILKRAEKKFGSLNMSKSLIYLDEGLDVFLTRVKYGINDKNRQRGL